MLCARDTWPAGLGAAEMIGDVSNMGGLQDGLILLQAVGRSMLLLLHRSYLRRCCCMCVGVCST